jgi:hypothetical protein
MFLVNDALAIDARQVTDAIAQYTFQVNLFDRARAIVGIQWIGCFLLLLARQSLTSSLVALPDEWTCPDISRATRLGMSTFE